MLRNPKDDMGFPKHKPSQTEPFKQKALKEEEPTRTKSKVRTTVTELM